jgi:phage tail-like protein
MPAGDDYVNTPVSHWTIDGDVSVEMIQSISGISESNAVEGTAFQDKQGNPNRPKWWSRATTYGDITLQRVLDTDQVFSDWRKEVREGSKEAKKALTITAFTADLETVGTWSVEGAWPSSIMVAGMDSASDAQSYEQVVLTIDKSERTG